jgi:hypothetical protein
MGRSEQSSCPSSSSPRGFFAFVGQAVTTASGIDLVGLIIGGVGIVRRRRAGGART